MLVCWGSCYSSGVRRGSDLSPFPFAVYMDGLLSELSKSDVGCYWRNLFVGAVCYVDDFVLLAPCPSCFKNDDEY